MSALEHSEILAPLKRPVRWTLLGLWAERITHAFWPLWIALLVVWSVLLWGEFPEGGGAAIAAFGLVALLALSATAFLGVRRFRVPRRDDALVRVDQTLPGRPVSAILDQQALGAEDAASKAVWDAHRARMRKLLAGARTAPPDLRLSRSDPYGLRYVALIAFVTALSFGSFLRNGTVPDLSPIGAGEALAAGPSWEVWIEPPSYTGKPTLYLNEIDQAQLDVPVNSKATVRLYGALGALKLRETVSGMDADPDAEPVASYSVEILQSGEIEITGAEDAAWALNIAGDGLPTVEGNSELERSPLGDMQLTFTATDDYGVVAGQAEIVLDVDRVDRRFGLRAVPEPREPIIVDLPMPFSGDRSAFTETLVENLSKHPWVGLPVSISLIVSDATGQSSAPDVMDVDLPGRRFFQPIARAVIELRRDLLWSQENVASVGQLLRTVTHLPEGFFSNETAYLTLRMAITRLEIGRDLGMSSERRDDLAEMLWQAALLLEDGSLSDALERLRRAQEKLTDAMRDGASDEEIAELMQELAEAMQDYMRQLAQQSQPGEQQEQAQNQDSQEVTQDQLQAMLDEIQRLMEEGQMAEAQALLDQLMEMMQNMQVTQGQQGQGQPSPGQQAMEGLQDTLRQQQGLSDESFQELQEQFNPGEPGQGQQNPGQQNPGQQSPGQSQPGQGGQGQAQNQPGQQGQGQQGQSGSLADRQQALRNELNRQQRNLPGAGTPEGEAAREALDRAGEAMDRAEEALRENEMADALDAQSDAMEALREGMRNLGEAMAQQQQQQNGQQGQQNGQASREGVDPLGREQGSGSLQGSDETDFLDGADSRRRAKELLDEIRRRSGDQDRPEIELDYLKRLLDRY